MLGIITEYRIQWTEGREESRMIFKSLNQTTGGSTVLFYGAGTWNSRIKFDLSILFYELSEDGRWLK